MTRARQLVATTLAVCALLSPTAGVGQAVELPNLVTAPPGNIGIGPVDPFAPDGPLGIQFVTAIANVSALPFDVIGEPDPARASIKPRQCIAWVASKACRQYEPIGSEYILDLGIWRASDMLVYELRRVAAGGGPDWSEAGLVVSTRRTFLCFFDVAPLTDPDNSLSYYTDRQFPTCTGLRMGVSPNWFWEVKEHAREQSIPLAGLEDGVYALVIRLDPQARLFETNRDDNVAYRIIELYDDESRVRVLS